MAIVTQLIDHFATAGITLSAYGSGDAWLLDTHSSQPLADIDTEDVATLLALGGAVLFRGFDTSLESFSAFVKSLSSRVTLDPARSFHGGDVAQRVDAGSDSVGLHLENGTTPFAPDLTWFFCERAASSGSQTTICDGLRVWEALSAETRAFLKDRSFTYSRSVEEAQWKAFAWHEGGRIKPMADVTLEDVRALASGRGEITASLTDDGSLSYRYQVCVAHSTLFSEGPAFANSILGPSYNYEMPIIGLEDGSELSADLLAEIEKVTAELTEDIDWQDGDVALIDNTRVMHGRRVITDPDRTIYNAQSFLAPELRAAVIAGER
ncbi:TauD/TfdA family dioxygenase [Streptomyces sp. NPDC005122]